MQNKYELNVLMTSRDRTILTEKSIDSLFEHSKVFKHINIYLYDNYSDLTSQRLDLVKRLIESKKICNYSYSMDISNGKCFPKMFGHYIWTDHMEILNSIRNKKGLNLNTNSFYLIMDNDMIVAPRWDEYFISCTMDISVKYPKVKFTMPYPSGIIPSKRDTLQHVYTINYFNTKEKITYGLSNSGGGSGFWFMNHQMLNSINLQIDDVVKTFNRFKHHDSTIWNRIKEDQGNYNYCAPIIHTPEFPLVIHIGQITGSICNSLTNNTYSKQMSEICKNEDELKDMNVREIYDKYKEECSSW